MTPEEFKARFSRWEHLSFEYGRWTTTHENYDASWEGEEDGWVSNGLMCEGRTLEELADECEEVELELAAKAQSVIAQPQPSEHERRGS
jgi:hypothetical protein